MAQAKTIPMSRHPYADGSYKKMLIDGKWVDAASGKNFESRNPATGELLATVAEGDAEDINRAVAAARRAFEGPWSKVKPFERQQLLLKLADLVEKHFDELSALDTLDMGAPISRTRGTRLRVLGMLRYYAGQATAIHGETIANSLPGEIFSYTLKEPVGVVGAIIPWNGPLGATVWKIGPALATGCTVILKPAEEAPLTSLRLGELALEAGVPPASSTSCPAMARPPARRWPRIRASTRSPSPARMSPASRSCKPRPAISSACRSSSAASRPTSCLPMPTSRRRCRAPRWRCSPIPARFAARERGCSSSSKSMTSSSTASPTFGKKLRSATASIPNTQIGPLVSEQQLERVTGYLEHRQAGGRPGARRRRAADRRAAGEGLFRAADGVRRCAGRHADRPGRDFRPGDLGDPVQGHRRSDQARQRHDLRSGQRRVDTRCQQGASSGEGASAPARSG